MEDLMLLVKNTVGELPKINGIITVDKIVSGKRVDFKVKKIQELRWNKEGDLIVEVLGSYIKAK